MGHWESERLLSALEGEFAAAVAAEEDVAAADLAFSLGQDVPITVDLARAGGVLLVDERRIPISLVAHDYIGAADWLVPLERAVIELGASSLPAIERDVWLAALRRTARYGGEVAVGLPGGREICGQVGRATPQHLVLVGRGAVATPLSEVRYVRRVPGGSADAL